MPTLEWIGKSKVVNHHLDVPYCTLDRKYSFDKNGKHEEDNHSQNMIIHGDNLTVLKSLLPQYEGKVKCIYIDPPYNTGNENWVYNDNVNDPQIKKWLGQVVGKEGEDLSRHDKWLCMMYPRLKFLQKLLADDGSIFISIDDNELYNLKMICDEIFGSNCFVADISWQRTYSSRNDSKGLSVEVEHILLYSKKDNWNPQKLKRTTEMNSLYKRPDNDPEPWTSSSVTAPGAATHQGMVYAIQHPFTGKLMYPTNGRHWTFDQNQMLENMNCWAKYRLKDLEDAEMRASVCGISANSIKANVLGIVLDEPLNDARNHAEKVLEEGNWPYFYFTNKGKGGLRRKTYLKDTLENGRMPTNFWPYSETGHTDEAKKELKKIFGNTAVFDTPKPTRLIKRVLEIASDPDSIILDSFAGSGTTAHAVLNMNKEDGGHRKFILVEMGDYADSITAERVKRVIHGYGEGKNAVEGTGGDFSFYELGKPLFNGDNLNEDVGIDEIRKYVYFTDTKKPVENKTDEPMYLGTSVGSAYYFYYDKNYVTTLNREFLHTIRTKADAYVIYADLCTLSEGELQKYHITFKKIPRDITRI